MGASEMQAFWDTVSRALREQDVDVKTPDGCVSNLIVGGYIQITAHGQVYRSFPQEYSTAWICWEPYEIVGHFSVLTDPKALVEWVPHRKSESHKLYELREDNLEDIKEREAL